MKGPICTTPQSPAGAAASSDQDAKSRSPASRRERPLTQVCVNCGCTSETQDESCPSTTGEQCIYDPKDNYALGSSPAGAEAASDNATKRWTKKLQPPDFPVMPSAEHSEEKKPGDE